MRPELENDIDELCYFALELANESRYPADYNEVNDLVTRIKEGIVLEGMHIRVKASINFFNHLKERFLPENLKFGWLKPHFIVFKTNSFHIE